MLITSLKVDDSCGITLEKSTEFEPVAYYDRWLKIGGEWFDLPYPYDKIKVETEDGTSLTFR